MKKIPKLIIALLLSVLLCIPSVWAILYYTKPTEDVSYDLSVLGNEDGEEWEGDKGWRIYTNEEGMITELTPDGYGGYSGADYPGQTFYLSRELTDEMDDPMLEIEVANQTVSVFLDDNLLYTDCPGLDNRIGHLKLPTLNHDRTGNILVSLPPDHIGKTLTIAQSPAFFSEDGGLDAKVYPCAVTLYCGYAYESSLIASAAKTMLPAVLLFSLEIFLLAAFIWNMSVGNISFRILVLALAVMFRIINTLCHADFYFWYTKDFPVDLASVTSYLSTAMLLLFLTTYAKTLRSLFLTAAITQLTVSILFAAAQSGLFGYNNLYMNFLMLPKTVGFITLSAALAGAFGLGKKGNRFFRRLSQAAFVISIGYVLFLILSIPFSTDYTASVFERLKSDITSKIPFFSFILIWNLGLFSTMFAAISEWLEQETERRTEYAVLAAKNELAVESYEHLRWQSEEIMIIRHDTMKHYSLLRTMAKEHPEQVAGYLDELIGQAQDVRPVVSSRNQTLNIIINGKLNTAIAKNISPEIIRSDAPENLPLTDRELCCLVMNILDNAIEAACNSEKEGAYIKLDFHCKNGHFVFSCENSISNQSSSNKKTPLPEHGYGLKIIRQIMKQFGDNMMSVEQSENIYKITVVIPCP